MTKTLEKVLVLPGGLEISYAEQGDRTGPALIILHGYTDSFRGSSRLMAHLPDWLRTIAITLRGHGDSSKPISTYRTDEHAGDVAAVMDALALDRAVIAGHSMGSMIAQRFAADYRERTAGLVLLGSLRKLGGNPVVEELWHEVVSKLADPIDPEIVRHFQLSTIGKPVPPAFLELVIEESLKVPAFVWRSALRSQMDEDVTGVTARIAAPTMVIWGDGDGITSHEEQKDLAAATRAELHVLHGVGHAVHWEEPEIIATLLSRFVATARRVAA